VRHLGPGTTDDAGDENIWRDHSLVDLVLAACDRSDDQAEICGLVDDFLREGCPGRPIGEQRAVPARRVPVSRACTQAA
jgi:hypothetical protein